MGGLAFTGLLIGMCAAVAYIIFYENNRYVRVAERKGGRADPEDRLPGAILGSFFLVIGLAWFSGTCQPSVHWIVPIAAGAPFGFGMVRCRAASWNYSILT